MTASSWPMVTIEDVCDLIVDCVNKTAPTVESATPYRMIRTSNIRHGRIDLSDCKYVSEETYRQWTRRATVEDGDVLLTREAPIGEVAMASGLGRVFLGQRIMQYRATPKKLDSRFLLYAFLSPHLQQQFGAHEGSGSVVSHIRVGDCYKFQLYLPELPEQTKIAAVLGAIDEKIDVNRKQVLTLELMARALFQSWFVDFDPVRAKSVGCQPFGMNAEVAKLFTDKLLGSDLGDMPADWAATTLADIVIERTGKVGDDNEHVVLSAVASGELRRSDEHFTKQVYSQDTSKYKRVEQWDYAYNPSRINIGSIGMLEESIVGAVSPVYTVLRPAEGYEWFLRFFLDLPQTKEVINQFCSGSVRQSLSFKDFAAIPVVLPPKEIAEAFTQRWQELNALRQKLAMQSSKLAEVRDTLLPKLMSGELRVLDELMA